MSSLSRKNGLLKPNEDALADEQLEVPPVLLLPCKRNVSWEADAAPET